MTSTTMEAVLDFEQCQAVGFSAISLGDKNDTAGSKFGLVLAPVKGQTCYIGAPANKEAGVFFTIPPVHIEVPAAAELLAFINNPTTGAESSLVGLLTPNKKLQTGPYTLSTIGVKQECDGKKAQILMEIEHNKAPLVVEKRLSLTFTFDEDEELTVV